MAVDNSAWLSRRCAPAIRSVDYLEAGIRPKPKLVSGAHRVRLHGPVRKVRGRLDIVWACIVLGLTSAAAGAVIGLLLARGGR